MRWALIVAACSAPAPAPLQATAPPSHEACPAPTPDILALVAKLDVGGDDLHGDFTPAVEELEKRDIAGGCAVLGALASPNQITRLHAARVLESIVSDRFGFRAGRGYPDEYAEEHVHNLVVSIGYDADAPTQAAIDRWRRWLAHPVEPTPDGPSRADIAAALASVKPALVACGEPLDVMVEFDASGRVSAIWEASGGPAAKRQCLTAAVQGIAVPPSKRASVWTHYPW